MEPTHVPAGHCRACGYPMDPGRCPECGTVCPDVSPKPRRRLPWSAISWALAVGLIPAIWAGVTILVCSWLQSRRTAGLTRGTSRFGDAEYSVYRIASDAEHLRMVVSPFVVVVLMMVLVILHAKRPRPGWKIAATLSIATGVGAISWIGGAIAMFLTFLWD